MSETNDMRLPPRWKMHILLSLARLLRVHIDIGLERVPLSKATREVQKAGRDPKWEPPVVFGPKISKGRRPGRVMNTRKGGKS